MRQKNSFAVVLSLMKNGWLFKLESHMESGGCDYSNLRAKQAPDENMYFLPSRDAKFFMIYKMTGTQEQRFFDLCFR